MKCDLPLIVDVQELSFTKDDKVQLTLTDLWKILCSKAFD